MSNLPIELKNQIDEIFSETNTILLEDNFLGENMTNITVYYKNNNPIFLLYNSDGNKMQTAFFPSTSNLKIDDLNQIETKNIEGLIKLILYLFEISFIILSTITSGEPKTYKS